MPDPHIKGDQRSGEIEMNSAMYHEIAKATVADRLLAAEHARTRRSCRAARPARQRRLPAGLRSLRGLIVTRRVRALARLRTA
jgi:hypothetical protein